MPDPSLDESRQCLIDVRTPHEFATAHIPGSQNVPLGDLDEARARQLVAEVAGTMMLVCRTGARAEQARSFLELAGSSAQVLAGGFERWRAQGGDVVEGSPTGMSLERQVRVVAGLMVVLGGALTAVVHPWFLLLPVAVGAGLVFAGVTDHCGLALLLARLPMNRSAKCSS